MSRMPPSIAVLALAVGACTVDPGHTSTNPPCVATDPTGAEDIPFPLNGFRYKNALSSNRSHRDTATKPLRAHAWDLFEAINKPSSRDSNIPVWRTWGTAYAAFRPDTTAGSAALRGSEQTRSAKTRTLIGANRQNATLPSGRAVLRASASSDPPVNLALTPLYLVPETVRRQYGYPAGAEKGQCPGPADEPFSIPQGDLFQNNGDIMLVTVPYNPIAYDWIRSQNLYSSEVLDEKKRGGARQIPEFPNGSTVLKHMYWPVAGDGYTALPLWTNPAGYAADVYLGYETWTTAVAVRGKKAPAAPASGKIDIRYLHGVDAWYPAAPPPAAPLHPEFADAPVHELSEFIHQTLSQCDLDALCVNDRAILDQSAVWAYGRLFREGDSIAMIAVHIVTKEMPNEPTQSGWSFQSIWWADANPRSTGRSKDFGAGRPSTVMPGYYMVVDDGLPDPNRLGYWAAHYNPFIEPVVHPVETSCQNCHARAAWPSKARYKQAHGDLKDQELAALAGTEYAAYQLHPISTDPGLLKAIYPSDPINDGFMTTDYQWAIVDRAGTVEQK